MKTINYLTSLILRLKRKSSPFSKKCMDATFYSLDKVDLWKFKLSIDKTSTTDSTLKMNIFSHDGKAFVSQSADDFTIMLKKGCYLVEVKEEIKATQKERSAG